MENNKVTNDNNWLKRNLGDELYNKRVERENKRKLNPNKILSSKGLEVFILEFINENKKMQTIYKNHKNEFNEILYTILFDELSRYFIDLLIKQKKGGNNKLQINRFLEMIEYMAEWGDDDVLNLVYIDFIEPVYYSELKADNYKSLKNMLKPNTLDIFKEFSKLV